MPVCITFSTNYMSESWKYYMDLLVRLMFYIKFSKTGVIPPFERLLLASFYIAK